MGRCGMLEMGPRRKVLTSDIETERKKKQNKNRPDGSGFKCSILWAAGARIACW